MKVFPNKGVLIFFTLFVCSSVLLNCSKPSDGPGPKNALAVQTTLLSKSWVVIPTSVVYNTGIPSADWSNLQVNFLVSGSTRTFTTTGAPSGFSKVWTSNGSWSFENDNKNKILRNDGVRMTISELTESKLTLEFDVGASGGKTNGITGSWKFSFNKK